MYCMCEVICVKGGASIHLWVCVYTCTPDPAASHSDNLAPVMPWWLCQNVVFPMVVGSMHTYSINYTLAVFVYTQRGSWACLSVHLSICLYECPKAPWFGQLEWFNALHPCTICTHDYNINASRYNELSLICTYICIYRACTWYVHLNVVIAYECVV